MDASELIIPNDNVAPESPAPVPAETEGSKLPSMPEPLLKIPAVHGLITGNPGAFSLPIKESKDREDLQDLKKYKEWLGKAGMYVYAALDGKTGVVANALYVHPEELKAADAAGKLAEVAPPFDQVNHNIAKSGSAHPSLTSGAVPTGLKGAPVPQPPTAPMQTAQSSVPPPPASAQRKALTAQIANLQPGGPTSAPAPGAGSLLRSILKPVV